MLEIKTEVMEGKIYTLIDDLLTHKTSKKDTVEKLLILFNVIKCGDKEKEVLKTSVSAIWFADNSDYLSALYQNVRTLTGIDEPDEEDIRKLFNELN